MDRGRASMNRSMMVTDLISDLKVVTLTFAVAIAIILITLMVTSMIPVV
jgi:hypothetical protein